MTILFAGLMFLDGWFDGSLTASKLDDKNIQGTILCILISILAIPSQIEFSKLAAVKNLKLFTPFTIAASILFATSWYWQQFDKNLLGIYLSLLSMFIVIGLFLYQYFVYGTKGTVANCGVNCFAILYLGGLSSFVEAIRVNFGVWPLLMFVFVVKCSDIGAYSFGRLFGKHQFSPKISPKKTWEGMIGAIVTAVIVAVLFSVIVGIMAVWMACVYGLCFAFIGQLGDLAESMIKRDVEQKDSSDKIPGFGGVLDVIDSPLIAAPLSYLFFIFIAAK